MTAEQLGFRGGAPFVLSAHPSARIPNLVPHRLPLIAIVAPALRSAAFRAGPVPVDFRRFPVDFWGCKERRDEPAKRVDQKRADSRRRSRRSRPLRGLLAPS